MNDTIVSLLIEILGAAFGVFIGLEASKYYDKRRFLNKIKQIAPFTHEALEIIISRCNEWKISGVNSINENFRFPITHLEAFKNDIWKWSFEYADTTMPNIYSTILKLNNLLSLNQNKDTIDMIDTGIDLLLLYIDRLDEPFKIPLK